MMPRKELGRPLKKPRTDAAAPKLSASRVKRSPAPQKSKTSQGKEKAAEKTTEATPPPAKKRKTAPRKAEAPLPSSFKIVAGSYEKLLYGLEGTISCEEGSSIPTYNLEPIFIFPAHVSCIKVVAASPHGGKWLATGSADEIIKVWDLRRRKEIGGLMHHEGSITHLTFPSRSHLLSASEDGTLCLFRARDWSVLRTLRGHKARVNSVAVHPSGKVALSVGKDRALRMWDLMRGKGVASTKLGKEGEVVQWSTDGTLFVVQSAAILDIYTTDMILIHTITHPSRIHDVKFCRRVEGEGDILLVGAEDKKLTIYDVSSDPEKPPQKVTALVGHANRVKTFQTLSVALPSSSPRKSTTIVATASSDGNIHVYDLAALPSAEGKSVAEMSPVARYDTKGTRLTCVTLADGEITQPVVNGKRKREDADQDGQSGDEEEEDVDEWEEEVEGEEEMESE
ncbi:unnamed protein product [Mycena citricolor]|uniref:WD40 repeat-like protein n=2 Tax=Mycena citricolor TaxID=2018698 RepID=A0AAD2JXD8_9AGAR|nr:unnamed protein product [Mycena citricolor]CAK5273667.1 unnamed protein product [Mycena citricolor]